VVFAVARHEGQLRRALARYKYGGDRRLAGRFAAQVAAFLADHPVWFEEFDVLTSVPAYRGPGARRTWDPVADILVGAGRLLGPGWCIEPGLVAKTGETPPLTGRTRAARQSVARGPLRRALTLAPGAGVEGSRVLVFDDVMTEGSTLRETARVLRRSGADEVAGLVLARPGREVGR
jgi:predicted amidophosphoribosyltransferase